MKETWKAILPYLRNKYLITIVIFTVWIFFFSQYNLVERFRVAGEIRQLENDRQYYLEQMERDSTRLMELTTDLDNLEKFAREQYLMKNPNEDLFVIIEE